MARPAHDYARVDKHVPVTRRAETTNPYSPVTILIALVATLGILLYAQFLLNPANRGDFLPYALVITAETILITHALLAMWTILSGAKSPRDFAFYESQNAIFDPSDPIRLGLPRLPHVWPIMLRGKEITVSTSSSPSTVKNSQDPCHCRGGDSDQGKHHLDPRRRPPRMVQGWLGELGCFHYVRRLSVATAPGRQYQPHCLSPKATSSVSSTRTVPQPDFLVETVPCSS
jgi:cellulose synthase (UDP-forming)